MGQEQNQIIITECATLRQLEILGDNGEEEAIGSKSGKGAGHPDTVFTRSKNIRRDPDAQGSCKPQNSPRNSPFSGAKPASVKRRAILLTSCAFSSVQSLSRVRLFATP